MLTSDNELICNYALPTIRNFLRKYPQEFAMFQSVFYELVRKAKSTTAKCAMLEIIGDFGEHIQDAIELVAWG